MSPFHARTARPISTKCCTDLPTNSGKVLDTSMTTPTQPLHPRVPQTPKPKWVTGEKTLCNINRWVYFYCLVISPGSAKAQLASKNYSITLSSLSHLMHHKSSFHRKSQHIDLEIALGVQQVCLIPACGINGHISSALLSSYKRRPACPPPPSLFSIQVPASSRYVHLFLKMNKEELREMLKRPPTQSGELIN